MTRLIPPRRPHALACVPVLALLLGAALPAQAIVSTTASTHWLATGDSLDGVTKLLINGSTGCSGTLLAGGAYVLTAAHCVTNNSGQLTANSVSVTMDGGAVSAKVSTAGQISVFGSWNGSALGLNNDLALLRLDSAVTAVAGYQVYAGQTLGSDVIIAGYGYTGTGSTGAVTGTFGTLHWGMNTYDTLYRAGRSGSLIYDFDDGSAAHNAIGSTGLGVDEASIASGDSGGSSFVEAADGSYYLVGVHSFGGREADATTDIDATLNSSYGEYAGDTGFYTASTAQWLRNIAGSSVVVSSLPLALVPEPGSAALMAAGGLMLAWRRRRA